MIHRIVNPVLSANSKAIRKFPVYKALYKKFCTRYLRPKDLKTIPIIINNRNRYTYLKELIDWLDRNGYRNYYVIDNASSYPPLLDYYRTRIQGRVFFLSKNVGHLSFWKTGLNLKFLGQYYIYTDSDLLPDLDRIPDFIEKYFQVLHQFPFADKVGSALKTDDLPDCFEHKQDVLSYYACYWEHRVAPDIYQVPIDTTMALYLPNYYGVGKWNKEISHLRLAGRHILRHQPWYIDSRNKSQEELYYIAQATTSTYWTSYKGAEAQPATENEVAAYV